MREIHLAAPESRAGNRAAEVSFLCSRHTYHRIARYILVKYAHFGPIEVLQDGQTRRIVGRLARHYTIKIGITLRTNGIRVGIGKL